MRKPSFVIIILFAAINVGACFSEPFGSVSLEGEFFLSPWDDVFPSDLWISLKSKDAKELYMLMESTPTYSECMGGNYKVMNNIYCTESVIMTSGKFVYSCEIPLDLEQQKIIPLSPSSFCE